MRKPGWCSGPSYNPVTVVTRVQIPLRAFSRIQLHERPAYCAASISEFENRLSADLNQGVEQTTVSGTTEVQIPLRSVCFKRDTTRAEQVDVIQTIDYRRPM